MVALDLDVGADRPVTVRRDLDAAVRCLWVAIVAVCLLLGDGPEVAGVDGAGVDGGDRTPAVASATTAPSVSEALAKKGALALVHRATGEEEREREDRIRLHGARIFPFAMPLKSLTLAGVSRALASPLTLQTGAPAPRLEALAAQAPNPLSLEDLARAVGVDQQLLVRVSERRQPLPESLVRPIADALGETVGAVRGSADTTVALRFAPGVKLGQTFRPLPPDRCLGDPIYFRPLRSTRAVTFGA